MANYLEENCRLCNSESFYVTVSLSMQPGVSLYLFNSSFMSFGKVLWLSSSRYRIFLVRFISRHYSFG